MATIETLSLSSFYSKTIITIVFNIFLRKSFQLRNKKKRQSESASSTYKLCQALLITLNVDWQPVQPFLKQLGKELAFERQNEAGLNPDKKLIRSVNIQC
ncbi:unnamed protein product [Orchesella dallaii]|uniref:Uncharacterized protein n=1 Tax=Orchesella dallaii TaxID=48710 RepID=A0ABP1PXY9_9HEXA